MELLIRKGDLTLPDGQRGCYRLAEDGLRLVDELVERVLQVRTGYGRTAEAPAFAIAQS